MTYSIMAGVLIKKYNVGIATLKILACIGVIGNHFGRGLGIEVPTFVLMAFLLSSIPDDKNKLFERLRRLLLPFWFWGLVGLFIWPLTTDKHVDVPILIARFVGQMILGSSLNSPLYFMFIIALLTAVFFFVQKYIYVWWLTSLFCLALIMQYTGINYEVCKFCPMGSYNVFGRILEFTPYAIMGIVLRTLKTKFFEFKRNWIMASILLFFMWFLSKNLMPMPLGFGYQGMPRFFLSLGIVILAYGSGQHSSCDTLNHILIRMSLLTPGIYYSHRLVGDVMFKLYEVSCWWQRMIYVALVSGLLCVLLSKIKGLQRVVS